MEVKKETKLVISVEEQELDELLREAMNICSNAVSYVGSANYTEREREAHANVTLAFDTLRKNLFGE